MTDHKETRTKITEAATTNIRSFRLYRRFADDVWASPDIDTRTTEILAVAVTHVTHCSTCVDFHSRKARALGVTAAQLTEAGVLAAALQTLAVTLLDPGVPTDPFLQLPFDDVVIHLDRKTKSLVVLAAAFAMANAPLVARARTAAERNGAHAAEVSQASRIAAALVAGSAIHYLADVAHVYTEPEPAQDPPAEG
jgi:AhpD family alkylhydroperoxidase